MSEKEDDKATVKSAKKPADMKKIVETKADGRLIIYYSFAALEEQDAVAPKTGAQS